MELRPIIHLPFASVIVTGYSAPIYTAKTPSYEIFAGKIVDDTPKTRPAFQIVVMPVEQVLGDEFDGTTASVDPLSTPVDSSAP